MAGGAVPDPREPVTIEGDPDEAVRTLVTGEIEEPDPDTIEPVLDQSRRITLGLWVALTRA